MAKVKRTVNNYDGVDVSQKFKLVEKFLGYRNREDKTKLLPEYMIEGSQNVLIDISGRLKSRKGYTLDGASNATLNPIHSFYDWEEHKNTPLHFRAYLSNLQFRDTSTGSPVWRTIKSDCSGSKISFTNFWDNTEKENVMLWVDGDKTVNEWNGATTTYASATASTAGVIATLTATPNYAGSGYLVNDILTITGGSGTATCKVTSVYTGVITGVTLGNSGADYHANDILSISYGDGTGGQIKVLTINGSGAILTYSLLKNGRNYSTTAVASLKGGFGTGADISIDSVADGGVGNVILLKSGSGYSATGNIATTGGSGTGCTVTIGSVITAATITKQGTTTWAEDGFYVSGNLKIMLGGTEYTYTGGTDSATLTGVTPDPSLITYTAGDLIYQSLISTANTSISDLDANFKTDIISTLSNQVYYGSTKSNVIYTSAVNDYKDCGFSVPRLEGEGALNTLDAQLVALEPQEQSMYASCGKSLWYQTTTITSSDNSSEVLAFIKVKTSSNQGAFGENSTSHNRNSVVFISNEPRILSLGRVENIYQTPQLTDYSFPIAIDMNNWNFTDSSIIFWRSYIYVAIPKEGKYIIYNMTDPNNMFWEAPQTGSFSGFSIIDGDLYAHSYSVPETYKLYDGYSDNGNPILCKAKFAYNVYGMYDLSKYFNEYFVNGYISSNTKLTAICNYDLDGCATQLSKNIYGDNGDIVCLIGGDAALGKAGLGKHGLGTDSIIKSTDSLPPYFNCIKTMPRKDFYLFSPEFQSYGTDYHWELLSFGPLVTQTMYGNSAIKDKKD